MKIRLFALLSGLLAAFACTPAQTGPTGLEIKPEKVSIAFGTQKQLEAVVTPSGTEAALRWWSDNSKVATVNQKGVVSTVSVGMTKIHVSCGDLTATCQVTVLDPKEIDPSDLPDSWLDPREALGKSLTNDLIFSKGVQLYKPSNIMQGWDFTDPSHFYYAQCPDGELQYISFCRGTSMSYTDYMTLNGFGHMTQITAEASTDGNTYIWCNSNGQWTGTNYNNSLSISRIKYAPGTTLKDYSGKTYVMSKKYGGKDFYDLQVAIDFEYRRLMVGARVSGVSIRFHWIFDLDEVLALPEKDVSVTVDTKNNGTQKRTFKGYDLNDCKVLGYFEVPRGRNPETDTYYYSHQGHEVHGEYVWFFEGQVDTNTTPYTSVAYITVFNYDGTVAIPRTRVVALDNNQDFINCGFTYDGNAEGECMKIKDNKLYLGFACHSAASSKNRIQNILVYPCQTK